MGGSGGHMRHPHDLDEVQTGKDIIALFRAIPAYLRSEEFKSGQTTSLKLDGSNNAIKVVEDEDGSFQFAVDRGGKGTSPETQLDVMGVTIDRLKDRFTKVNKRTGETKYNEGLANSSAGLINMMAKAYYENEDVMFGLLQELGLIDENGSAEPTKFINIEYIDRLPEDIDPETSMGRANAIYYAFDSITFLNISQYYEVTAMVSRKDPVTGKSLKAPNGKVLRDLKKTRPGLERPKIKTLNDAGEEIEKTSTDVSTSIDFERKTLDELARLVQPYAPKSKSGQQFQILGPGDLGLGIDHDAEENEDIDVATERAVNQLQQNIENTLNSNLTFTISDQLAVTRTLEEWLSMAINFPYKPDITLIDGSKKGPFHKDLHNQLVDLQTPLAELVPLGDDLRCEFDGTLTDCEKAIYGATFYEAARRLGNVVKQSLQSKIEKFGSAVDHEGVVINAGMPFGDKVTGNTFKLTGEFIVDGNQGVYAIREQVEDEDEDPVIDIEFEDEPVREPELEEEGPKTIAIVPGAYKPPHKGHLDMVIKYLTGEGISVPKADKVIVIISKPTKKGRYLPDGTEVGTRESLELWNQLLGGMPDVDVQISENYASPINAGYDLVGKETQIPPKTNIILGASKKGDDWKRWAGASKYVSSKLNLIDPELSSVKPKEHDEGYIETLLRNENQELYSGLPSVKSGKNPNEYHASDFRYMIGKATTNPVAKQLLESFIGEGNINALFATFGLPNDLDEISGMALGSATLGVGTKRKKIKNKKKQRESNNLKLVDNIMRLIMERGIVK
jgi:hypothetical protein